VSDPPPAARWVRACELADLTPDQGLRLGTTPPVAIFLSEGGMFCLDDTCTHETYSLADGWVENCVVECALHFAKFDLRTGAVLSPPAATPLSTHELRLEGDDIHVLLPSQYIVNDADHRSAFSEG
jgi:3-phenylpropionate/trans-cinnamate dioxygenase ferredoxin component